MTQQLRLGERFRFARTGSGAAGLLLAGFVILLALFGPFFAPHSPTQFIGAPGMSPTAAAPLGGDFLGRDVLSRVLWGGRELLALATLATLLSYAAGTTIGLIAGYARGPTEAILMRSMDVLRVFPALLLMRSAASWPSTLHFRPTRVDI